MTHEWTRWQIQHQVDDARRAARKALDCLMGALQAGDVTEGTEWKLREAFELLGDSKRFIDAVLPSLPFPEAWPRAWLEVEASPLSSNSTPAPKVSP